MTLLDSLVDPSTPRRWLKIFGMYNFLVLQLRAGF